jgi:hypothetical protein
MDEETYASLPDTLTLREMRGGIGAAGCRVRELTLVTTLTDPALWTKDEIVNLYGERWSVEITHPDYRSSDKLGWSRGHPCPGGVRLATTRPVASFLSPEDERRHHMSAPRSRPSAPKN